jgi:hypothetical protein
MLRTVMNDGVELKQNPHASQEVGERHQKRVLVVDAHRDDGKRFVVRAHEKLTAFLELEAAIHACGELA